MPRRRHRRDEGFEVTAALTTASVVFPVAIVVFLNFLNTMFNLDPRHLVRGACVVCAMSTLLMLWLSTPWSPKAMRSRKREQFWSSVQARVRDGVRIISIASSSASAAGATTASMAATPQVRTPLSSPPMAARVIVDGPNDTTLTVDKAKDAPGSTTTETLESRADELLGIVAAFPIALQHHVLNTRALPHAPIIDLLPAGFLASLKRTEARVRFAAAPAGPSGSGFSPSRTAVDGARLHALGKGNGSEEEWELTNGNGDGNGNDTNTDTANGPAFKANGDAPSSAPSKKSNLYAPYPANMPLTLLRLMEAYITGLSSERGGWMTQQSERALAFVHDLNTSLSEAETLYLSKHMMLDASFCLNIFLGAFPFLAVAEIKRTWLAVLVVALVGLGSRLMLTFVATEPDPSSNSHPLKKRTLAIVHEALDTCPALARYYRTRLVARLGTNAHEVSDLDRRNRRRDEWLPKFP